MCYNTQVTYSQSLTGITPKVYLYGKLLVSDVDAASLLHRPVTQVNVWLGHASQVTLGFVTHAALFWGVKTVFQGVSGFYLNLELAGWLSSRVNPLRTGSIPGLGTFGPSMKGCNKLVQTPNLELKSFKSQSCHC